MPSFSWEASPEARTYSSESKSVASTHASYLLGGDIFLNGFFFFGSQERFGGRVKVIARPSDADTATGRGAAQYGLARRPLVSSVVAPRSYMMKVRRLTRLRIQRGPVTMVSIRIIQVKLPAEPEDFMKRPAYVSQNNAGVSICENR